MGAMSGGSGCGVMCGHCTSASSAPGTSGAGQKARAGSSRKAAQERQAVASATAKNTRDMLVAGSDCAAGRRPSASSAPGVSQLCLQVAAAAGRRDYSSAASGCWFWSCSWSRSCWPSMLAVGAGGRDWPCIRTKKKSRALLAGLSLVRWLVCCGADKKITVYVR